MGQKMQHLVPTFVPYPMPIPLEKLSEGSMCVCQNTFLEYMPPPQVAIPNQDTVVESANRDTSVYRRSHKGVELPINSQNDWLQSHHLLLVVHMAFLI